jgi:hypothetical protein
MPKKKSWSEKLHAETDLPKVGRNTGRLFKKWGDGTHVVPAPLEVDALMRSVRRGRLTTIDQIRSVLAKRHRVDTACPLTTGIFAWIAAYAADEAEANGKSRITPYWRTLKSGGELNPKYPGGIENLRHRLEAEGQSIVQRGKRYYVADWERSLVMPR